MGDAVFHQDLHRFAVELRQLAYTMPAGHEDRLIHLAERMAGALPAASGTRVARRLIASGG